MTVLQTQLDRGGEGDDLYLLFDTINHSAPPPLPPSSTHPPPLRTPPSPQMMIQITERASSEQTRQLDTRLQDAAPEPLCHQHRHTKFEEEEQRRAVAMRLSHGSNPLSLA
jgi:hypothetical protein